MPVDLGSRFAQHENRQRGGADAVGVIVAVHADPFARGDGRANSFHGSGRVSEQKLVVQRLLAGQEGPRLVGVAVSAPDEHAGRDLADPERLSELARLPVRARTDRPSALLHRGSRYGGHRTDPPLGATHAALVTDSAQSWDRLATARPLRAAGSDRWPHLR